MEDIPITTKISQLKKYLRKNIYINHAQYHTPTQAILRDVSSDPEDDNSSFEVDEEDEVEDDRHIVDRSLSKGSFGRKHRRHNFAFSIAQKIGIVLLAKEWNNVRGTKRYFRVLPATI
jgi:hypothetical protein